MSEEETSLERVMSGKSWEEFCDTLKAAGQERDVLGRVVLGTVKGDIHEIGKSLVGTMLSANGFEVFDVGIDVVRQIELAHLGFCVRGEPLENPPILWGIESDPVLAGAKIIAEAANGPITAETRKGKVKTWVTLDAAARWVRSLGMGGARVNLTH